MSFRLGVVLRFKGNVQCFDPGLKLGIKVKVEYLSCDCIVKEMAWNQSEKVDHVAYKYWCILQGSGVIKIIRNLAKSWFSNKHCAQKDVYGTTKTIGIKIGPHF